MLIVVASALCVNVILIIESPLLKWFVVEQFVWFLLSRTLDEAWIWLNSGQAVQTEGRPKQPSLDEIHKAQCQFDATLTRTECNKTETPPECDQSADMTIPYYSATSGPNCETLLPAKVANIPYVHGGYFGAAPFLIQDPLWLAILRKLMPMVFVQVAKIVATSPQAKWIQWGEDNPVVAAYGIHRALIEAESMDDCPRELPVIEWDVFLDPKIVQQCEMVMYQKGSNNDEYHRSLQRWGSELVESMLIAHGTISQIIFEQFGPGKEFNFERVKETPLSRGGGVSAREWMAIFAHALSLANELKRSISWNDETKSSGSCTVPTLRESCDSIDSIFGTERSFQVVLDLKSRHVPLHVWGLVVDTLHQAGIVVRGVGSFYRPEIRGLSNISMHGEIKEVTFFHSAGDVQKACHDGRIKSGDCVMFNAGSLISRVRKGSIPCLDKKANDTPQLYQIYPWGIPGLRNDSSAGPELTTLMDYKATFHLSIGLYCQEYSIDPVALTLLTGLVNEHPELYNLGLAWGGVNGVTVSGVRPGIFTNTDGYSFGQRLVGRKWNNSLQPMVL